MTYGRLYERGESLLKEAGIEEAKLDARLLLEYVCHTDRNTLLVHGDREVSEEEEQRFGQLLERRSRRVPLQYIMGTQEFMGLEFTVNENVLIPRQDTEILVEEVLKNLHDGMRILDMCTGSGCILISLLRFSNDCIGTGADISEKALETARVNAGRLLAGREHGSCSFCRSNLFENITGIFDIIVSNPPYICSDAIGSLMPEVREYEPRLALDGEVDGLAFYRRIIGEGSRHLTGGGMLFFEIGSDQAEAVSGLMAEAGYLEINVVKDYAGLDRVVYGTRSFARM